jgi:hypothetical protein
MKSLQAPELSALMMKAEKIGEDAARTFGHLSPSQLNWKRSPEEWSVGQCFEHLILTNQPYFPLFEKIAQGKRSATLWERVPLLPGFFGRLVLGAVKPEAARKIRARPKFLPQSSNVDAGIIDRFREHQRELVRLMKTMEALELEKVVITSPVSSLVTYSAMDGCRIIVAHEERHFLQADRVMKAEEFPRSL